MVLAVSAALGASFAWACGLVLAHAPARTLGAFEFTRVQLLTAGALLSLSAALSGAWTTVTWAYWPAFAFSAIVSVIVGNLAMIECLRRGGARRTQLLLALSPVMVGLMAYVALGETLRPATFVGALVAILGVFLAIAYGNRKRDDDPVDGPPIVMVLCGVIAAASQGAGLLAMKPAMLAGTDPLAASAIRTTGAAFALCLIGLWPSPRTAALSALTPRLLGRTVVPGIMGYGVAVSLLLYAFANFNSAVAAVLGSLAPVMVLPLLWAKTGIRPHLLAWIGAAITVAGGAIIILT